MDIVAKMNATTSPIFARQQELTIQEKLEVKELEQLDRSVREHERAHLRTAGDLAVGGATFEYQRGPDGQKYAVHGEVNISASVVDGDTEATIDKALKARYAALAPSDPSPQDRQSAARAQILESKSHRKLSREQAQEDFAPERQPGELETPGVGAYRSNMNFQDELFTILDLFA